MIFIFYAPKSSEINNTLNYIPSFTCTCLDQPPAFDHTGQYCSSRGT